MKGLVRDIQLFLMVKNKRWFIKRKSRVVISKVYEKLDKSKVLGENVPHAVLAHFSNRGASNESITHNQSR